MRHQIHSTNIFSAKEKCYVLDLGSESPSWETFKKLPTKCANTGMVYSEKHDKMFVISCHTGNKDYEVLTYSTFDMSTLHLYLNMFDDINAFSMMSTSMTLQVARTSGEKATTRFHTNRCGTRHP